MNSSSRAISSAILEVKILSGEIVNRWWRICSLILSFFLSDILGIELESYLLFYFLGWVIGWVGLDGYGG